MAFRPANAASRPRNNPYIGIVVFIFIPVIFVLGLVLTALGMFLARRRIARVEQGLERRPPTAAFTFASLSFSSP